MAFRSIVILLLASCGLLLSAPWLPDSSVLEDTTAPATLPKVAEVDLNRIDPALFSEEEWYVPYYLKHFAKVANAVVDSGVNRGFIDIPVWRPEDVNEPYNARIMEGILSLAWFYTKDRPWNPYFGDPALKARLEAAIGFWCKIQNNDGRFSEYGPGRWSLAPTAFATKFVGRALVLLSEGPPIDAVVLEQARIALRKALRVCFAKEEIFERGSRYTNQYANLWGGALMYLHLWPDEEIERLFRQRFRQSMTAFQSPCGFFYERGGPDWGYNLSTHHSNLHVAWHYAQGKPDLKDAIVEKTERWYEWFSYNAVKEPGGSCFFLNRAVETRQRHGFYQKDDVADPAHARWAPQAEFAPSAHAFELSREEYAALVRKKYAAMRQAYPVVAPLMPGAFWAFSPYAFLHEGLSSWRPTQEQKQAALAGLPYLANDRFTHLRFDARSFTTYIFVRRPAYYAVFNAGRIIADQQRYGLGTLWTPEQGAILQSQSRSDEASWGTRADGSEQVYEAADLLPVIKAAGKIWEPRENKTDLPSKTALQVTYALGDPWRKNRSLRRRGHHRVRSPSWGLYRDPSLFGFGKYHAGIR